MGELTLHDASPCAFPSRALRPEADGTGRGGAVDAAQPPRQTIDRTPMAPVEIEGKAAERRPRAAATLRPRSGGRRKVERVDVAEPAARVRHPER